MTTAIRTHCSAIELADIQTVDLAEQRVWAKPRGLWYSFDGDWLSWCESEQPDRIGPHWYAVEFAPEARIRTVSTPMELRHLHDEFGGSAFGIDWRRVAQAYDAIEIVPYLWSMRLSPEAPWYYGWDVASGCVWNGRVAQLRAIERPASRRVEVANG